MKTEVVTLNADTPDFEKIAAAAKVIRQGGLVIFPTETVYGIAANYQNAKAMKRLKAVKGRPAGKPFAIMLAQKELISNYTNSRDPAIYKLIDTCWPGPLTVVVPAKAEGKTVGLRVPHHKIALQLVQEARCPVAAPSANLSGKDAPATCEEALKNLRGKVEMALDSGPARFGQASSVVDFSLAHPTVVRVGAISQEAVDHITQKKQVLFVCTGNSCRSVMAEYLLRNLLKDRLDVEIASAGTGVFLQASASQGAIEVLRERGLDASQHRAQSLNSIMLHKADLILVMTRQHRQQVLEWAPEVESRVYQLKEFDEYEAKGTDLDIPDPMGRSRDVYEECLAVIERSLRKVMKLI